MANAGHFDGRCRGPPRAADLRKRCSQKPGTAQSALWVLIDRLEIPDGQARDILWLSGKRPTRAPSPSPSTRGILSRSETWRPIAFRCDQGRRTAPVESCGASSQIDLGNVCTAWRVLDAQFLFSAEERERDAQTQPLPLVRYEGAAASGIARGAHRRHNRLRNGSEIEERFRKVRSTCSAAPHNRNGCRFWASWKRFFCRTLPQAKKNSANYQQRAGVTLAAARRGTAPVALMKARSGRYDQAQFNDLRGYVRGAPPGAISDIG